MRHLLLTLSLLVPTIGSAQVVSDSSKVLFPTAATNANTIIVRGLPYGETHIIQTPNVPLKTLYTNVLNALRDASQKQKIGEGYDIASTDTNRIDGKALFLLTADDGKTNVGGVRYSWSVQFRPGRIRLQITYNEYTPAIKPYDTRAEIKYFPLPWEPDPQVSAKEQEKGNERWSNWYLRSHPKVITPVVNAVNKGVETAGNSSSEGDW